jgi:signal recognition particle subunit SRP54
MRPRVRLCFALTAFGLLERVFALECDELMFETLSERLGAILDKLTRRGALTEADVAEAMREVRRALLEADVALDVVRDFTEAVKAKAVGQEVVRSITPGQMVIKIVHDELVRMLGSEATPLDLATTPPVVVMMVGLQGSGKTTSTAKIARRLQTRDKQKVLMASLDTRRPAAQEQLRVLGEQTGVAALPIVAGEGPLAITKRALSAARLGGFDVLMLDTAGRTHIDEELMAESAEISALAKPHETLLVADALTGQDAVNLARSFDERLPLTGIVLTRVDGDGRGGAALSMRAVTGKPIKLMGTGEKLDAIEDFDPSRIAGRILGMGDVVGLVEKAIETVEIDKAEKIAAKVRKGAFDLEDLSDQLKQMEKLGGMGGVLGMLPGVGKIKKQLDAANLDETILKRQQAIIGSMTRAERKNPKLLNASRKKRVAAGSGTSVQDINKLVKMHRQMADMMKAMGKKRGMFSGLFGGGPPPEMPTELPPDAAAALPKNLPPLPPGGFPGLGGALPRGLPGLPGGAPRGLPGLPKSKKR